MALNLNTLLNLVGLQRREKVRLAEIEPASFQKMLSDLSNMWQVSDERNRIFADIDRMYDSDEYVSEAIDTLVGDCLRLTSMSEPVISVECNDEELKKAAINIINRSRIVPQSREIMHAQFRYHNAFAEFIVDQKARPLPKMSRIVNIQSVKSMYRNTDVHGQLLSGDPAEMKPGICAYDQRDQYNNLLASFYPYQIIHWRIPPFDTDGYGIPFLKSARANWIKLQLCTDTIVMARLVRAYLKLVHKVPVPDNAKSEDIDRLIQKYRDNLLSKTFSSAADGVLSRTKYPSPYRVDTDFFLPQNERMKGEIQMLDPSNAQLQNVADIKLLMDRLFARLKVPKARLANEQDVRAKATMIEINTAYAAVITGYQLDFLAGVIDMVNRALFLEGYDIDRLDPSLRFSLPSPFIKNEIERANIEQVESQAALNYQRTGVLSRDTIRQIYLGMSADESEIEQDKVDKEPAPLMSLGVGEAKSAEEVLKSLHEIRRKSNGNGNKRTAIGRH